MPLRQTNALGALCAVAVTAGAALAQGDGGLGFRLIEIQRSGLAAYDCSLLLELENGFDVTLEGFAAELVLHDHEGLPVGRKPFEWRNIRPGATRIEVAGLRLDGPREIARRCANLKFAVLVPRACRGEHENLFDRCRFGLYERSRSALPVRMRRDAVEVAVDFTDAGGPAGYRAPLAEAVDLRPMGLAVTSISKDLARARGLSSAVQGLLVTRVAKAGAASACLREGDVIGEIDQEEVFAPDQAARWIDSAKSRRRSVLVLVDRGGEVVFCVVRPR